MNGLTLPKDLKDLSALDALAGFYNSSIGQENKLPQGVYRYVKINRWKDQRIKIGQAMFLRNVDTWEVTGQSAFPLVGVALNNHRYHWWEYALWLLTRKIQFSPIRYVFIQESGSVGITYGEIERKDAPKNINNTPRFVHLSEVSELTAEDMKALDSAPYNPTLKFDYWSIPKEKP